MPCRLLALGLVALAVAGCSSEREQGQAQPFTLFFTCDTSGRIEPCGCFTGQYGGLTRVSTVLKAAPGKRLCAEVGNAIAGTEDYHVLQYKHLLDACAEMGYAAVNAGEREARLPREAIRHLAANSPVPLLSANIVEAETREPLLQRSVVVDYGGIKVGFAGVVDPKSVRAELSPGVEIDGMEESLRRALASPLRDADVRVCLAFTDEDGLKELARQFYEFDIILGGDVRQPSTSLTRVNQSWILATTNQSRALGVITAEFHPSKGELENASGDVQLMKDTIRQDPDIKRFLTNYRREVRETELAVDRPAGQSADRVPGIHSPATYVGSHACASCHRTAFDTWKKSGHSHAFRTLVEKDSDSDPSCIKCHVVGFEEPGGYLRSMKASRLTEVGCESCHGPGSRHIAVRSAAKPGEKVLVKLRPVGAGQCTQCHYGEFSRPFKWYDFWPHIAHGKEGGLPHSPAGATP